MLLSLNWKSRGVFFVCRFDGRDQHWEDTAGIFQGQPYSFPSRNEGDQNRLGWVDRHSQTISAPLLWLLSGVYLMYSSEKMHTPHYWNNTQKHQWRRQKSWPHWHCASYILSRQCLLLSITYTREALHRI